MHLHFLSGGRLRMQRSFYYPDAIADETFELPVSCTLLKHPQGNALFDTGCHPDAATNGRARWGDFVDLSPPIFRPEEAVINQLGLADVTADDIDLVICSHFHYDHCGCNTFFRRATVMCHARELEALQAPDTEAKANLKIDWDVGLPFAPVTGQHDVFGDGRLTLIPLPGHTPGMMGAHAVLDRNGPFLLASDAAPVEISLSQRFVPTATSDIDNCLRSLDEIARFADDGATVIYGHDDKQWRSLRKGSEFYG